MRKNLKTLVTVAVLSIGIGAYTLPAFAQADDYGQYRYTGNDPTRFAPEGLPHSNSREFRATIDIGPSAGARDVGPVSRPLQRDQLNDRLDREHSAW